MGATIAVLRSKINQLLKAILIDVLDMFRIVLRNPENNETRHMVDINHGAILVNECYIGSSSTFEISYGKFVQRWAHVLFQF